VVNSNRAGKLGENWQAVLVFPLFIVDAVEITVVDEDVWQGAKNAVTPTGFRL
jgi:hypothetical protein